MRTSAVPVAALRALALAVVATWAAAACDEPAPPRTEPDTPAAAQAPAERADARRGDRHARAAARHASPMREVTGTIVRTDGRRVAIRSGAGSQLTLRVGPETRVTVGGRKSAAAALRPGDDVRASYRAPEGGPATALSVEVGAPPPDPAPAAPPASAPADPPTPETRLGGDAG